MKQLFTDDEYKFLIEAACNVPAKKSEIMAFLKDCERMKVESLILASIQSGLVKVVGYQKGKAVFSPK